MRSPNEEGLFKGYGRSKEKLWISRNFLFKTHGFCFNNTKEYPK